MAEEMHSSDYEKAKADATSKVAEITAQKNQLGMSVEDAQRQQQNLRDISTKLSEQEQKAGEVHNELTTLDVKRKLYQELFTKRQRTITEEEQRLRQIEERLSVKEKNFFVRVINNPQTPSLLRDLARGMSQNTIDYESEKERRAQTMNVLRAFEAMAVEDEKNLEELSIKRTKIEEQLEQVQGVAAELARQKGEVESSPDAQRATLVLEMQQTLEKAEQELERISGEEQKYWKSYKENMFNDLGITEEDVKKWEEDAINVRKKIEARSPEEKTEAEDKIVEGMDIGRTRRLWITNNPYETAVDVRYNEKGEERPLIESADNLSRRALSAVEYFKHMRELAKEHQANLPGIIEQRQEYYDGQVRELSEAKRKELYAKFGVPTDEEYKARVNEIRENGVLLENIDQLQWEADTFGTKAKKDKLQKALGRIEKEVDAYNKQIQALKDQAQKELEQWVEEELKPLLKYLAADMANSIEHTWETFEHLPMNAKQMIASGEYDTALTQAEAVTQNVDKLRALFTEKDEILGKLSEVILEQEKEMEQVSQKMKSLRDRMEELQMQVNGMEDMLATIPSRSTKQRRSIELVRRGFKEQIEIGRRDLAKFEKLRVRALEQQKQILDAEKAKYYPVELLGGNLFGDEEGGEVAETYKASMYGKSGVEIARKVGNEQIRLKVDGQLTDWEQLRQGIENDIQEFVQKKKEEEQKARERAEGTEAQKRAIELVEQMRSSNEELLNLMLTTEFNNEHPANNQEIVQQVAKDMDTVMDWVDAVGDDEVKRKKLADVLGAMAKVLDEGGEYRRMKKTLENLSAGLRSST